MASVSVELLADGPWPPACGWQLGTLLRQRVKRGLDLVVDQGLDPLNGGGACLDVGEVRSSARS